MNTELNKEDIQSALRKDFKSLVSGDFIVIGTKTHIKYPLKAIAQHHLHFMKFLVSWISRKRQFVLTLLLPIKILKRKKMNVNFKTYGIPPEFKQRIKEWNTILDLLDVHFKDRKKSTDWIFTPNPLLGNVSPHQMIKMGRFEKLKNFIEEQLSGNSV